MKLEEKLIKIGLGIAFCSVCIGYYITPKAEKEQKVAPFYYKIDNSGKSVLVNVHRENKYHLALMGSSIIGILGLLAAAEGGVRLYRKKMQD